MTYIRYAYTQNMHWLDHNFIFPDFATFLKEKNTEIAYGGTSNADHNDTET